MLAIRAFLSKIPHLLFIGLLAFGGGVYDYLTTVPVPTLLGMITTQAGLGSLGRGALAFGLMAIVALLKPSTAAEGAAVRLAASRASKPPPLPVLPLLSMLVSATYVLGSSAALMACGKPPASFPDDLQAEARCVYDKLQAGETSLDAFVACVGGDVVLAMDLLEWLLSSKASTIPPANIATIQQQITAKRAEMHAGAVR